MELRDFVVEFNTVYTARLFDGWRRLTSAGEWIGKGAAGSIRHAGWRYNPCVVLRLPQPASVFAMLSQPDPRLAAAAKPPSPAAAAPAAVPPIGFMVVPRSALRESGPARATQIVLRGAPLRAERDVSAGCEVQLAAGEYVLVPFTLEPGHHGYWEAEVRVSEGAAELQPLPSVLSAVLSAVPSATHRRPAAVLGGSVGALDAQPTGAALALGYGGGGGGSGGDDDDVWSVASSEPEDEREQQQQRAEAVAAGGGSARVDPREPATRRERRLQRVTQERAVRLQLDRIGAQRQSLTASGWTRQLACIDDDASLLAWRLQAEKLGEAPPPPCLTAKPPHDSAAPLGASGSLRPKSAAGVQAARGGGVAASDASVHPHTSRAVRSDSSQPAASAAVPRAASAAARGASDGRGDAALGRAARTAVLASVRLGGSRPRSGGGGHSPSEAEQGSAELAALMASLRIAAASRGATSGRCGGVRLPSTAGGVYGGALGVSTSDAHGDAHGDARGGSHGDAYDSAYDGAYEGTYECRGVAAPQVDEAAVMAAAQAAYARTSSFGVPRTRAALEREETRRLVRSAASRVLQGSATAAHGRGLSASVPLRASTSAWASASLAASLDPHALESARAKPKPAAVKDARMLALLEAQASVLYSLEDSKLAATASASRGAGTAWRDTVLEAQRRRDEVLDQLLAAHARPPPTWRMGGSSGRLSSRRVGD